MANGKTAKIGHGRFLPHIFLSCKANARVYLTKTGHNPHSS